MTKTETLKPGTRVLVFEDPISQKRPEGHATIVAYTGRTGQDGLWYEVRFDGETETVQRKLYLPITEAP